MSGLTSKQARERLRQDGENELSASAKLHPVRMFLGQFRDVMVLILLAATAVSAFLGEVTDAVTIILIVLLNAILGFLQEFRTEQTLESLRNLTAPTAAVCRDGTWQTIPARELVRGDCIRLEAGDNVPADAALASASGLAVNESILTGESEAVAKRSGDPADTGNDLHKPNIVYAGTAVLRGSAEGIVIATGTYTQMGKISVMLQDVRQDMTPLQKRLAGLGKVVALLCLGVCAAVFLAGILRGEPVFDMLMTGITIAIAAIPEGLPATVTIALALAVSRMMKHGALVNRLHSVETLGCASVICSDKTGTITRGAPEVIACDVPADALRLSAALEAKSEHPLARAVVFYAARSGALGEDVAVQGPGSEGFAVALSAALPEPESFEAVIGSGVTGIVEGHEVFVGSRVVVDGVDIGGFDFADAPKPDARETIETLANEYHVDSYMVTGDGEGPALAVAEAVGIPAARVFYGVRPLEKAQCVRDVKEAGGEDGVTAFVGDGINDAPALAAADVGIAMASGTDVALDAGSVVLMHNRLSDLVVALRLSKATMRKIRQNLFWALIYNCIMIPLAAVGILAPALAGAAMALSSVSVVCNSLLLKRFR